MKFTGNKKGLLKATLSKKITELLKSKA